MDVYAGPEVDVDEDTGMNAYANPDADVDAAMMLNLL